MQRGFFSDEAELEIAVVVIAGGVLGWIVCALRSRERATADNFGFCCLAGMVAWLGFWLVGLVGMGIMCGVRGSPLGESDLSLIRTVLYLRGGLPVLLAIWAGWRLGR